MKRSRLKRKTPLARGAKRLKRTRLKRVSAKGRARGLAYSTSRECYLHEHKTCEARIVCTGSTAIEVHHKAGRYGKNLLDQSTWCAICRPCHHFIHFENPGEARRRGLLL